jgi:hypothetical protein
MPTLNLNNIQALYYGNNLVQKMYKGSQQLYPPSGDPYFNNVVLYLNGALTDSSNNPKQINNFGAILSNIQSKNNPKSILVSGNEYLTAPMSNDFNLGTSDFTIEFCLYLNTMPSSPYGNSFLDSRADQSNTIGNYSLVLYPDATLGIGSIGGNQHKAVTTVPLNQWSHIAFCRLNGVINIYLNGMLDFSGNFPDNLIQSGDLKIMANAWRANVPNLLPNCYFDFLRITKGIARYTSNFNPEINIYR